MIPARLFAVLFLVTISASAAATAPVAASLQPIALLVDQVSGARPAAVVLPSARRNAHHPGYRPSDRLLAARAKPLFWLGDDQQPALGKLLAALTDADPVALTDHSAPATEHPWLDLPAAARMGRIVAAALAARYPERAGQFERRAVSMDQQLGALVSRYRVLFAQLPARDYIAEHDAFSAFDRLFGLHSLGALIDAGGDRAGARSLWQLQRRLAQRPAICLLKLSGSDLSLERIIEYPGRVVAVTVDPLGLDVPSGDRAFVRFANGVLAGIYRCIAGATTIGT